MDDAEFVKSCRRTLGLSQNELAELLGKKSDRTIRKWEDGGEVQRTDLIALAFLVTAEMEPGAALIHLFDYAEGIIA